MLIGGIWHGAGWTFVIWGALHGLSVAFNQWWDQRRRKLKRKPRQQWWVKALCIFATFHFVCLAWVFFRAESVGQAWQVLARLGALQFEMANLTSPALSIPLGGVAVPVSVLAILILAYLAHWFPKNAFEKVRDGFTWLPSPVQAAMILTVALGLYYATGSEVTFVYGNF